MDHVILIRFARGNVVGINTEEGNLYIFPNFDEAYEAALLHPLCAALPYQIVELNEL